MNRFPFWLIAATSLLSSSFVYATPTPADKEAAKKLYRQAVGDMEREAFDRACPQFEAALQLDPEHIRTAMTLGTCEDHWGKLARALRRYEYARSLAVAQSARDKLAEIDQLIADLHTRLPKLRIIVPEHFAESSGLIIVRNGTVLLEADFGKALPVDPGIYEIAASAPELSAWKTKVELQQGQTADVTIGQAATVRPNVPGKHPPPPRMDKSSSSAKRPVALALGFTGLGLGAAGLAAGGVLGGFAIMKNDASNDGHCDAGDHCDKIGTALRHDAQRYGNVSTVLFIAGGVLLTTGVIVLATTSSKPKPKETAVQTSLWIGPGSFGVRGRW